MVYLGLVNLVSCAQLWPFQNLTHHFAVANLRNSFQTSLHSAHDCDRSQDVVARNIHRLHQKRIGWTPFGAFNVLWQAVIGGNMPEHLVVEYLVFAAPCRYGSWKRAVDAHERHRENLKMLKD